MGNWLHYYGPTFSSIGQLLAALSGFIAACISVVNLYQTMRVKAVTRSTNKTQKELVVETAAAKVKLEQIHTEVNSRFSEVIAKLPDTKIRPKTEPVQETIRSTFSPE